MERRGIVIEQLFEDLPSDALTSGPKPDVPDKSDKSKSKSGKQAPEKSKKAHRFVPDPKETPLSKSLHSIPDYGQGTSSTHVSASRRSVQEAPVTANAASANRAKTAKGERRDTITANAAPYSPTAAVSKYKDKLTKHELSEIQNFPNVYYAGIAAKKLRVGSSTELSTFDDEENFYRVVPRDHIAYRYEVVEKPQLGKGTFGEVIKAFDHREKRQVAIKLVRNERIYLKQSKEELRILQALRKQDTAGGYNVLHIFESFM